MSKIEIFADTGDLKEIERLSAMELVKGITTNPTLLLKAGTYDYQAFAAKAIRASSGKPISLEVFADDFAGMFDQGRQIASWGENVFVKVPITTTSGIFTGPVVAALASFGVKLNVTAITHWPQVAAILPCLQAGSVVSIFAGRIADTGRNPLELVCEAVARAHISQVKALWASAREVYNVVQADEAGCDIITLAPELIGKLDRFGLDLEQVSLETVRQFRRDSEGISL